MKCKLNYAREKVGVKSNKKIMIVQRDLEEKKIACGNGLSPEFLLDFLSEEKENMSPLIIFR